MRIISCLFASLVALTPVITVSTTAFIMSGCAGKEVNEGDPAEVFADAEDDIENDRHLLALEKLRKIRHKFPYSKYAIKAQLRIADVYFLQESFAEAASAYEAFRDLHPKADDTPYAVFRIGESYFMDTPSDVSRDHTSAQRALDAFEEFVEQYPKDKRVSEARKRIGELQSKLAEKELYIADFYRRRDFYLSALPRYEKIVSLYPATEAAKIAKERIAEVKPRAEEARAALKAKAAEIEARDGNY